AFEHGGRRPRALDLLARAAALAERAGADRSRIDLDLARALAEIADDRPAAIARARGVPPRSPESFEARLLEARWSAELGDLAAAGVALGRLGDAVETSIELVTGPGRPPPDGRPVLWGNGARFARREDACAALAALCVQGAQLEEQERRDPFAARRLLGLALRLRPHERRIEQAFRRLAALAAPALPAGRPPTPVADATAAPEPVVGDEEQVDRLTAKLRADPSDQETVRALATLLERLGRDHDLLALLSARLEEAPAEIAGELNQSRRAVLARLAAAARAAGRNGEAELYEAMGEQRGE
ncbi:MAG: hypothetical protein HY744_21010, partial [Deltaproteobacteria bacterium]|nr:hypothetical protein [Deltaproteobacteria bacterium]